MTGNGQERTVEKGPVRRIRFLRRQYTGDSSRKTENGGRWIKNGGCQKMASEIFLDIRIRFGLKWYESFPTCKPSSEGTPMKKPLKMCKPNS